MTGPDDERDMEAIADLEVDQRSAEEVAGGDGTTTTNPPPTTSGFHITKTTDVASPKLF